MIFLVRYLCAKYMTAHKISLNITKPKTLSSLIIQGVAECYKTISNDRNDVRDAEVAGSNPVISTIETYDLVGKVKALTFVGAFYILYKVTSKNPYEKEEKSDIIRI